MNKLNAILSLTTLALASAAQAQTAQVATLVPSSGSVLQAWTPSQVGGGYSVNSYVYDDGASENATKIWSGAGTWGTTCWMNLYPATGGADVITKIEVAFGSGLFPNNRPSIGEACTVGVWSDPNQDGNPNDGLLIGSEAGFVTVLGDAFQTFTLTTAVPVTGNFFVGAWMANAPTTPQGGGNGSFPAAIDNTFGPGVVSWLTGGGGTTGAPGAFSPATLVGLVFFPTNAPIATGVFLVRAEGSGATPTVYCTAKTNSLGCTPTISSTGAPFAANTSGFVVSGSQVRNNKNGLLFYGANTGQAATSFQGGTLCVKTPIKRTQAVNSGGNPLPANDCSGVYSIDMNAFAYQAGPPIPPAVLQIAGTTMNVQFWGRDPGFSAPNNTTLTDGLEYIIQ